jgi:hypothetical protein
LVHFSSDFSGFRTYDPVEGYIAVCSHVWCDVNFSYAHCLFVLLRVDEQVTEEPGAQQVENTEQELVEGKL